MSLALCHSSFLPLCLKLIINTVWYKIMFITNSLAKWKLIGISRLHIGWVYSVQLRFFGHLARTAPEENHHRVIGATLRPPADWRRPVGHVRTTWLTTIDDDLQSLNFGVHMTWRKARDRDVWHQVVSTAMLHHGVCQ